MPWDRTRYPLDWERIAEDAKRRAGYRCEHCGIGQYDVYLTAEGTVFRMPLAAAHVHGEATNDPDARLVCLCLVCHAVYDGAELRGQRAQAERERLIAHGQRALWPDEPEGGAK